MVEQALVPPTMSSELQAQLGVVGFGVCAVSQAPVSREDLATSVSGSSTSEEV